MVSNSERNFWDCDFIKNVVRQFLRDLTRNDSIVAINALFMLYCELEEKNLPYEDEGSVPCFEF